ncbi:type II secretion system secretin GspD [Pseudomaricurvus alcaniphilus]|uniref:type II secretion system secretin GspD n=1 Tax=Pseudomaricurvus alcaniphilus TaxID=1166482 RepID=UPI001408D8FF|nr:type II secretion system secretin GspD [Pseudomaricurvus alcaniphilus]
MLYLVRQVALGAVLSLALGVGVPLQAAPEQTWTVNFKDSDIQEVIKFVAEVTGRTLVVDPRVKGRVQVISARPMNQAQLYELFLSLLEIHGFTAVEVGGITQVIPVKNARTSATRVMESGAAEGEAQITRVIQLKNIEAVKVLAVIRPLAPQHAHIAAYDPSNALVITDTPQNIRRIEAILQHLDKSSLAHTELIPLEYAQVDEIVKILEKLDAASSKEAAGSKVKIVADTRSNGILVSGDDMQRRRIKDLVQRLDFPQPQGGNVRVVYLEYARAERIAEALSGVLQGMSKLANVEKGAAQKATVEADEDTNSLLITADVEVLQSLLSVIKRLDIRRAQVLVEAIVVEVNDTGSEELGIQWLFQDNNKGFGASTVSGRQGLLTGAADVLLNDGDRSKLFTALADVAGQTFGIADTGATDFMVLLRALQDASGVNILSTPSILTTDNNEATISVGDNVPFVTGSYTSTSDNSGLTNPFQTIQRENVGIILKVTPHVNEGDSIVLDIEQEVSSILNNSTVDAADIITSERKITTQIMAEDGEVVVLGGLIKDDVQINETRVPLLGSVPVLGRLFRSEDNTVVKQNLMVFIRARVIRNREALSGATAEKYRYIREQQAQSRNRGSIMINGKELPILPEWQDPRPDSKSGAPAAATEAAAEEVAVESEQGE